MIDLGKILGGSGSSLIGGSEGAAKGAEVGSKAGEAIGGAIGGAIAGEKGKEIVVYGNKWWLTGEKGAEFAPIPAGSIIFNARQSKELLEKGFTNSRASGSVSMPGLAHVGGTAYRLGTPKSTSSKSKKKSRKSSGNSGKSSRSGKSSGSGSSGSSSDSNSSKDTEN